VNVPQLYADIDRTKARQLGVPVTDVFDTMQIYLGSLYVNDFNRFGRTYSVRVQADAPFRARPEDVGLLKVRSTSGEMVPLSELGRVVNTTEEQPIYRKDLRRLALVTAETAGTSPVNAVLSLEGRIKDAALEPGYTVEWAGEGEWNITVTVFRDLGAAFGAALFFIYILLVAQTGSMGMPLIIMAAIPLTLIGIMPGFFILNLLVNRPVAGDADPGFFTATAMIGMSALAGIVVRNSIILIDFIHHSLANGLSLEESVLEAGAIRLRPIALTAGAAMLGSVVITLDPIFSGLAWAFIFGIFASTAFTLLVVPLIYYLVYRNAPTVQESDQ